MIGRRNAPPPDVADESSSGLQSFDDFELRLGDIMRGERATKGKSLLDVQRELKIKASYIAAIENADPSAFEAPGFVAGYVRSYARYLGIDAEWAYRKFCEEGEFDYSPSFSPTGPLGKAKSKGKKPEGAVRGTVSRDPFENPNTPFTPRGESALSKIEPGALGSFSVMIALICGIGYGGWSVLQQIQKVELIPVEQTPGVIAEVGPLAPAAPDGVETAGLAPPPVEAYDRLYRPQALDVPVLTARDAPIATLDPRETGTLAEPDRQPAPPVAVAAADAEPEPAAEPASEPAVEIAAAEAPPVQVVEQSAPEVVMFAVRPAWVRVRGADGTVLFEKVLDAGEQYVLPQMEGTPTLRAGNAGAVYFRVAGQTYGPAGGEGAVVKNVAMGPEALRGSYALADLSADSELARVVASLEAADATE